MVLRALSRRPRAPRPHGVTPRLCARRAATTCAATTAPTTGPKASTSRYSDEAFYESIRRPLVESRTLPGEVYLSDEFFALEQRAVFKQGWFAACHVSEVADKGMTKVVDVGDQSYLVVRGRDQQLRAFHNVCVHRGARLCEKDGVRKRLTCPYHWWSYALDGVLKATSNLDEDDSLKRLKGKISLQRVHVDTFAGLIWLNATPHAESVAELRAQWPGVAEAIGELPLDECQVVAQKDYDIPVNWKLLAENFMEWYHLFPVHPELSKFSTPQKHQVYQTAGQHTEFVTSPLTNSGGPVDLDQFLPLRNTTPFQQQAALFYHLWPNASLSLYPHSMYSLVMLPDGPRRTREKLTTLQHPDTRLPQDDEEAFAQKGLAVHDFVCHVNDEDVDICNRVQKGMATGVYEGGYLSSDQEQALYRFQNLLADAMTGQFQARTPYPADMTHHRAVFGAPAAADARDLAE